MHRANAVYVLGSDQRSRYGKVIDVATDGVLVDLSPHRRREYVPFTSVFREPETISRKFNVALSLPEVYKVEILVPETPAGPWIWVRGEMHSMGPGTPLVDLGSAVFHWQNPGTEEPCTDIVPVERVRFDSDSGRNASLRDPVYPGTFIKRSVDLGMDFRSMSTEGAQALVKRLNGSLIRQFFSQDIAVVGLADGQLDYIAKLDCRKLPEVFPSYLQHQFDRFNEQLLCMVEHLSYEAPASRYCKAMALPAELWQEIFAGLDTVQQTQLRAVCATWNRIMKAPALYSTIVIRTEQPSCSSRFAGYFGLATVYHCLRPGTQRVVITCSEDGQWRMGYAMTMLDLIKYTADYHAGIRLRSLYLYHARLKLVINRAVTLTTDCDQHQTDFKMPSPEEGYAWLKDFLAVCRGVPRDAIHIVPNRVASLSFVIYNNLHFTMGRERLTFENSINMRTVRLKSGVDFGGALWDAWETTLPVTGDEEVHALHWLKGVRDAETKRFLDRVEMTVIKCVLRPRIFYFIGGVRSGVLFCKG